MSQAIGKYRVLGEIARGGMGVVYRAEDSELDREVAIKLLLAGKGANEGQRSRFSREARSLARLQHPNVMPIHDAGEHQGAPFLVMPLVTGRTLQERLDREGPLPPSEAADLVRQVAGAVAHSHQVGVLHRDLKPENVLVLEGGVPLLTDFGLARDVDMSLSGTRLSVDGQFLGTPGFWAPEQARGELKGIGPHTDVYGLGALLFALLTNRAPIVGASLVEVLASSTRPPTHPSRLRRGIPSSLERICMRCLASDPARRFPSAEAVAEALIRYREQEGAGGGRGLLAAAAVAAGLLALTLLVLNGSAESPQALGAADTVPTTSASSVQPTRDAKPQSAVSLAAEGAALYEVGDFGAAQQAVDRALAQDPQQRRALLVRARLLTHWTDFPEAIAIVNGIPGSEGDADALEVLSQAYAGLSWFDRASSAADRLIALDPSEGKHYLVRARVHLKRKDAWKAGEDVQQSLRLLPKEGRIRARAVGLRAQLFFQASKNALKGQGPVVREQTRGLAKEALELDPACDEAHYALIQLAFSDQDWERCEEIFAEAIASRPRDPEQFLRRAWVRSWCQDLDGARSDYDRAIELWPGYPLALSQRAMVWVALSERAEESGTPRGREPSSWLRPEPTQTRPSPVGSAA